jgi:hypothetical protein
MKFPLMLILTLAAGLAVGTVMRSRYATLPSATTTSIITNVITNTVRTIVNLAVTNQAVPTNEPFHWGQIASSDLKQYVASLRAVECPEQTVKDILLAIVNKQFAPKFAAFKPQPQSYWQKRRQYFANVEQARQLMALEKERRDTLKELLGYDVKDPDHRGYKPEELDEFTFLSPERRAALSETLTRLREQKEQQMQMARAELETAKATTQFSEHVLAEKWRELERQTREQFAKLLTKEELEQYDLRTSGTARHLRHTLAGFEPTPDEFREIFRFQRQLDEQFNLDDTTSRRVEDGRRPQWNAAKGRMEAQLKETLGEQRFADYQRSQDFEYQSLLMAVDKYDLSTDVPNKAWSLRQSAEAERQRILAQLGVSPGQQKAQLEQLTAATRQQMTTLMGDTGFERYQRLRGPNWWLTELGKPLSAAPQP